MEKERRCIVVMGGSFNPPTMAHLRLLEQAVAFTGARLGIFVPVSHAYLTRKMKRMGGRQLILSELQRYRMLCAMCADHPQLTVSPVEFGTFRARTRETMAQLMEQYPQDEFFFFIGADKLDMVAGWFRNPEYIPSFRLLVVPRDGMDAQGFIASDPRTAGYPDHFVLMPASEANENVSSTSVRQRVEEGESLEGLVHSVVERILTASGETAYKMF